ncbi:hypothetical protein RhiLY_10898 [Ceratobasidium sp. AG-Ba]|nr:hypothetical protein RhiLY_10898 [Ceratobasidium sp. AG-Ba]
MGAMISEVKSQIDKMDNLKQKQDEIKEALENMQLMATDQLDLFNERIRNPGYDTHLIPISKILDNFQYIMCTTSNHDKIGTSIKEAIKDFSTGTIANGIANLAENIFKRLLGESSGDRFLQTHYTISVDELGGIARLDTLFFVYNFRAAGLRDTAGSVCAACVVKSSADVTSIDDNTLRVIVNQCFETSDKNLRKQILAEVQAAVAESRKHPEPPLKLENGSKSGHRQLDGPEAKPVERPDEEDVGAQEEM